MKCISQIIILVKQGGVIKFYLSDFKVRFFKNGKDLVVSFQELNESPDMMLMDLHMPKMNGFQCCQTIRGFGYKKPIVAVSGGVTKDNMTKAVECGFTNFLGKPFKKEVIRDLVYKNLLKEEESNKKKFHGNFNGRESFFKINEGVLSVVGMKDIQIRDITEISLGSKNKKEREYKLIMDNGNIERISIDEEKGDSFVQTLLNKISDFDESESDDEKEFSFDDESEGELLIDETIVFGDVDEKQLLAYCGFSMLLVVENSAIQEVLQKLFISNRYSVRCVNSEKGVESLLEKEFFDIVIVCLNKNTNGKLTCQQIEKKNNMDGKIAPVVGLTFQNISIPKFAHMESVVKLPIDVTKLLLLVRDKTLEGIAKSPLYSYKMTKTLLGFSRDLVVELLNGMKDECRKKISRLEDLIQKRKYHEIAEEAHSLKGIAAQFCIKKLVVRSVELEAAAKKNNHTMIKSECEKLKVVVEAFLETIT